MKAKLFTHDGTEKGVAELPDEIFGIEVNEHVLHLVIKSYLQNKRQGTAKAKNRHEVSGGGKKPWRQKGTGRARAGSNTSPIWVRGGVIHGPVPRQWYSTIPKKMRHAALCSAYSSRAKEEKILIVENLLFEAPKTKTMDALLTKLHVKGRRNLLIVDAKDTNIYLSGRNIPDMDIKQVTDVNAHDIITHENIVFSNIGLIEKVKEVVAR